MPCAARRPRLRLGVARLIHYLATTPEGAVDRPISDVYWRRLARFGNRRKGETPMLRRFRFPLRFCAHASTTSGSYGLANGRCHRGTLEETMRVVPTVALFLVIFGPGCGGDKSPAAPTPAASAVPACQTNHTGTVTFTNNTGFTIYVLWNGAAIQTLEPGRTSPEIPVVADGTQYALDYTLVGTSPPLHPCNSLMVTPRQCEKNAYASCSFR